MQDVNDGPWLLNPARTKCPLNPIWRYSLSPVDGDDLGIVDVATRYPHQHYVFSLVGEWHARG